MATLDKLPALEVIKGYRGILDFYVHKGVPCVRTWPKKFKDPPSQKTTCNQQRFREFMKTWKYLAPHLRDLDRSPGPWTGWRSIDFCYRRYVGKLPMAPQYDHLIDSTANIPCPDTQRLLWRVTAAYWQVYRTVDYPPNHPLYPNQPHYWYWLVFWTDLPWLYLDLVFSSHDPTTVVMQRRERGTTKDCAEVPSSFISPTAVCLDTSMYGEYPPVTHNLPMSQYQPPYIRHEYAAYLTLCKHPHPWWQPYDPISIGPYFLIVDPCPAPSWLHIGQSAWHLLDPLWPTPPPTPRPGQRPEVPLPWRAGWHPDLIINRSKTWQIVSMPPNAWPSVNHYPI